MINYSHVWSFVTGDWDSWRKSQWTLTSKGDYSKARAFVSGMPVIGSAIRGFDNMRYMDDYLSNRGLDWSDVRYPSRSPGGYSDLGNATSSAVSFVSGNIKHLYK